MKWLSWAFDEPPAVKTLESASKDKESKEKTMAGFVEEDAIPTLATYNPDYGKPEYVGLHISGSGSGNGISISGSAKGHGIIATGGALGPGIKIYKG